MTDGHRGRLLSSLIAIEELAGQMARAGRDGKSPTSGQALAPLAPDEWAALQQPLESLRERLRQCVEQFAGYQLTDRSVEKDRSATLFWLSVLLRRLDEEIVDDLEPGSMERKFGELSGVERAALADLVRDLKSQTASARMVVDGMKRARGGRR